MSADKRQIIYELLVQIKGMLEESKKAQAEFTKIQKSAKETQKTLKLVAGMFGVGWSLQGIASTSKELGKLVDSVQNAVGEMVDGVVQSARLQRQLGELDDATKHTASSWDYWEQKLGKTASKIADNTTAIQILIEALSAQGRGKTPWAQAAEDLDKFNDELERQNRIRAAAPITMGAGEDFFGAGGQYFKGGQPAVDFEQIARDNLAAARTMTQNTATVDRALAARQQQRVAEFDDAASAERAAADAQRRRMHPELYPDQNRGGLSAQQQRAAD